MTDDTPTARTITPWWHKLRSRKLVVWIVCAAFFGAGVLSEDGFLIATGSYLGMQGLVDGVLARKAG